jgi:hypothetical protein
VGTRRRLRSFRSISVSLRAANSSSDDMFQL